MGITHPDPGRPRTVARRRSPRVQARVDAYNEDSARFVDADPVFEAAKSGDELESLYLAREELARNRRLKSLSQRCQQFLGGL